MRRPALVMLVGIMGLAACAHYGGVAHVKAGSTAANLVLQFAADDSGTPLPPVDAIMISGGPLNMSRRASAPSTFTWFLAAIDTTAPSSRVLREIRYGMVPAGFTEAAKPLPLLAGKYGVVIRAGHVRVQTSFVIDSNLIAHD